MLENNLKDLGTMLVNAGNIIERQKKEIEQLKQENQKLKDKRYVISTEEFVEKLESKILEAIETALKCSKYVNDKNDIRDILNVQFFIGEYQAYHFLMRCLDRGKFVELLEKYNSAWLECQNVIEKLYH